MLGGVGWGDSLAHFSRCGLVNLSDVVEVEQLSEPKHFWKTLSNLGHAYLGKIEILFQILRLLNSYWYT